MRQGKIRKEVEVADNLEEMPSYSGSLTCRCECGAVWKLANSLHCPDCDGSHTYEVVDPVGGYAPEGQKSCQFSRERRERKEDVHLFAMSSLFFNSF